MLREGIPNTCQKITVYLGCWGLQLWHSANFGSVSLSFSVQSE